MTSTPSLRIDTAIQPTSLLRFLLYGGLGSIMGPASMACPFSLMAVCVSTNSHYSRDTLSGTITAYTTAC